MSHPRSLLALFLTLCLAVTACAGPVPFAAFAGDNIESFEAIAGPLPFPNFGVTGIRGPVVVGYTTPTGLVIQSPNHCYINDWAFGQANISSLGVSINSVNDVIDGSSYFFTYNSVGRVIIDLPFPATRWGAHMGGNGVQNTTFEMYLSGALVDSFTTSGLTDFNNFTGWQSAATFDSIEWNGNHAGFDLFSFDGSSTPPASCTLVGPAVSPVSDDVSIQIVPSSMSAATVNAFIEYTLDGGMTFTSCTAAASSPLANPAVGLTTGPATFLWDSRGDGVGLAAVAAGVTLRATVDDLAGGPPGTCVTAPFDIDNTQLCTALCGDCNSSASGPDILDALMAARFAAGLATPTVQQMSCCDVDANTLITVLDALGIAQEAAGLPVTLTCP